MNAKSLLKTGLALLAVAVMASCASPVERRIERNPELYSSLPEGDKALISQGKIREGFSKEAVFLAWGRPDRVAGGTSKGVKLEKWTYVGSQPVYTNSFGWGGGWGGYGPGYGYYGAWDPYWAGYGPTVTYVPYKAASVTFRGNRVTEFIRGPQ